MKELRASGRCKQAVGVQDVRNLSSAQYGQHQHTSEGAHLDVLFVVTLALQPFQIDVAYI